MKQVTNMSRLVNQLEKTFRMLNTDFFDGELDMPVITVTPSSRTYAHYTPYDAWAVGDTGRREINIASGTLDRPLESIIASLLHEAVHMYNDTIANVNDCSRGGTYHNRYFRDAAIAHGLICLPTDRYGWAKTLPSDELLEWILLHDELREIELCRFNPGAATKATVTRAPGMASRRYICPCCSTVVRASKTVRVICADCMLPMVG